MEDGKPSGSAVGVAIQRVVHQVLDDDPKIPRDPIALQIVEGLVRETFARRWPQWHATASPSSLHRADRTFSMRQRSHMEEGRPSLTAGAAAMTRAAHLLLDNNPKVFADDLVLRLSGAENEATLQATPQAQHADAASLVVPMGCGFHPRHT